MLHTFLFNIWCSLCIVNDLFLFIINDKCYEDNTYYNYQLTASVYITYQYDITKYVFDIYINTSIIAQCVKHKSKV